MKSTWNSNWHRLSAQEISAGMIIPGRELGRGQADQRDISIEDHGLSPPFPGVPGEQCPLQKARWQPGLDSHQSGHIEAGSPAAGSQTPRQL